MLTGGFYSIDPMLLCQEPKDTCFAPPFTEGGRYGHTVLTNNGRTASIYSMLQVREQLAGRRVLLPDYLCVSVLVAMDAAGVSYDFYGIKSDLSVDLEDLQGKITGETGMIYVIHYFGVPQPQEVAEVLQGWADRHGLLIFEDMTQALFSQDSRRMGYGHVAAASTRKWFPMTDGGISVLNKDFLPKEISLGNPYNESAYKELLISVVRDYYENNPELPRKDYLEFEREANASRYVELEVRGMTEASQSILFNSDKEELKRHRRENYGILYEGLKNQGGFRIFGSQVLENVDHVPFGFLLLTEERDGLYSWLIDHDIIPEIQWDLPMDRYEPGEAARSFSRQNLMIQCDQRYGPAHMQRVVEVLKDYEK